MPDERRIELDYLFIAIPELAFKPRVMQRALDLGILTQDQYDKIRAGRLVAKKLSKAFDPDIRGLALIERIMAVAPELFTIATVNLLRTFGLINETQGHALRIAIRSLTGPVSRDSNVFFARFARLMGLRPSHEHIDLLRTLDIITPELAEKWRGMLTAGNLVAEQIRRAKRAKSLLDALTLLGELPISEDMIRGMVRAGLLDPRIGQQYLAVVRFGHKQWKVFDGARAAEGYQQRLRLLLTGSMNRELLDFLVKLNLISRKNRRALSVVEIISRQINERQLQSLTRRKYRVLPGERPIQTYARAARITDGDLLRLLADSAREARREALALAKLKGIGAPTRSAQYNLAARGLHIAMREMWENVGYLTIWGESQTAEAAIDSMSMLQSKILRTLPPGYAESLSWQAKAGVDSYVSREENTLHLSRRVYKNIDLWEGKVDTRIKMSLLQGRSADEIAKGVYRFISPQVQGGPSYAAMRLARTELNNAFHFSTIRYTRENPWVMGYKWNRSRSHPATDECDTMATRDHSGLGPGVYRKNDVPGKPHPQCLCYLTTVQMDQKRFAAAYRAGRFNTWLRKAESGHAFEGNLDSSSITVLARSGFKYAATSLLD